MASATVEDVRRDDPRELGRLVARFRWRLGWEQALRSLLQALAPALLVVAGLQLGAWLVQRPLPAAAAAGALLLPLVAALALALARWPSAGRAARAADHRLRLDEQLATAVELVAVRPALRLAPLQVEGAVRAAGAARAAWPSPLPPLRPDLARALGAAGLALATALLASYGATVPRPSLSALLAPAARATPVAQPTPAQPALPPPLPAAAPPRPGQVAPLDAAEQELDRRAQQAQAQRQALDRLARALRGSAAARAAADSLQQGDYQHAADQVKDLGTQADQLSRAAKDQLSKALRQAAAETTTNAALAQREQQAANALAGSDYASQQRALQQLGDEVQRAGNDVESHAQLAQEMERIQQQRAALGQPPRPVFPAGADPAAGAGAQPAAAGAQAPAGAQGSADGQDLHNPNGSAGAGEGAAQVDLGQPGARLDAVGTQVDVPLKAGNGPADQPADQPGDRELVEDVTASGADAGSGAQGAPAAAAPEQNLVPGDRRQVVRDYFSGDGP